MRSISIIVESRETRDSYAPLVASLLEQNLADVDIHFVTDISEFINFDSLPKYAKHSTLENAIQESLGDFLLFVGRSSVLVSNALDTLRQISTDSQQIAVWYSTQLLKSEGEGNQTTELQPHFSPERLLGDNYLRSGFLIRRDSIINAFHWRPKHAFSSLYELLLQVSWHYPFVGHIRKSLFIEHHDSINERTQQIESQVVADELSRRSVNADVDVSEYGSRQIRRKIFGDPLVSIIIPTGSQRRVVRGKNTLLVDQCVNSILERSTYENLEIIVIQDQRNAIDHSLISWASVEKVRVVPFSQGFNFADKCNLGFVHSDGHFVIFLNDDTEVISKDWIETLVGHLQDIGVGMSGPTLLLEDGRIQSASLCNNPAPHNYGAGQLVQDFYLAPQNQIAREVSGLTGACIALRRDVYTEMGGMCSDFPNNFNDIDLCFKLLYKNYRIIWTPFAQLTHFEAQSRDPSVSEEESHSLRSRWGRYFNSDKYTPV